jgi:hypothetical protein
MESPLNINGLVPSFHRFTAESYLLLQAFTRSDCVTPQEAIAHHTEGWPPNFFQQLAVALDIPVAGLKVPFGTLVPFESLWHRPTV